MYWPALLALALFVPVAWRYIELAEWERYVVTLAVAAFGFVSTAAAEETAAWTGRYEWTYERFWTYPPNWIRSFGVVLLVGANLFGFSS
jgi:hypothetical protein